MEVAMRTAFSSIDQTNFEKCTQTCEKIGIPIRDWVLLVNVDTQTLHVFQRQTRLCSYALSTSKNGTGQEEGSGKTPLGLHAIATKVGDGASRDAIFESRVLTGAKATAADEKAHIVARILWLKGLEKGYNLGWNENRVVVDSEARYIYFHGTMHTQFIDECVASSGGCFRMKSEDVINLYNQVPEEALVYIYRG